MKEWTIEDLSREYNLDFEKIINLIKKENAKRVLLQFPDGLKQYAKAVVNYLEEKTSAEFFIYLGTCFGACDTPLGLESMKIDLMIQIGHNSLMPTYLR
jgi:2-(3-amino-3-carboxypropyl)histidine synthase